MGRVLGIFWRCVQVGEMKLPWWLGRANLPSHLYLVMVDILRSVRTKWKITKLQFKKQEKYHQREGIRQLLRPTRIVKMECTKFRCSWRGTTFRGSKLTHKGASTAWRMVEEPLITVPTYNLTSLIWHSFIQNPRYYDTFLQDQTF